jgi:squalene-associated FAD-dependent desaturase
MAATLGGRARTVSLDVDGSQRVFDNGQHILIGAYCDTLRLMQELGVDPEAALLRLPLSLVDGRGVGLRLPGGNAAGAFLQGVMSHEGWSWRSRLLLLWAAARWAASGFRCDPSLSVTALCGAMPAAVRQDLIEPLCVAALNTTADEASATVFLRVLRDALFSGPGSADLLLPRLPLGSLLAEPAAAWLIERGAQVLSGCRVMAIEPDGSAWRVDGQRFDGVLLCCTASEAARLVRSVAPAWSQKAAALRYEPIVTLFIESAGTRLPQPMTLLQSGAADGPAQFVFDHGWLSDQHGLLSFVISAAQPWVDAGAAETAEAVVQQSQRQLGEHIISPLKLLKALTEKRATFRCTPGMQRPAADIASGLLAAGDYIDGPYPATLEGAVRSGLAAARGWRAA